MNRARFHESPAIRFLFESIYRYTHMAIKLITGLASASDSATIANKHHSLSTTWHGQWLCVLDGLSFPLGTTIFPSSIHSTDSLNTLLNITVQHDIGNVCVCLMVYHSANDSFRLQLAFLSFPTRPISFCGSKQRTDSLKKLGRHQEMHAPHTVFLGWQ